MRVLLDACIPRKFSRELIDHDVMTARQAGLHQIDDGPMLDTMAGSFDVLVPLDKSIPYQNTISGRPLSVILLRARSSKLEDLKPLVPGLLTALADIAHGEVRVVMAPTTDG